MAAFRRLRCHPAVAPQLQLPRVLCTFMSSPTGVGQFFQRRQGDNHEDPYNLLAKTPDPISTLSALWLRCYSRHSSPSSPPISNLTGYLSNFSFWFLAYHRTCLSLTSISSLSLSPASTPSHHLHSLLSLRNRALSTRPSPFPWNSSTHLLLRSPTDPPSTRRIGRRKFEELLANSPPPFQDRVVQELLLLLLEPVFEPRFSPKSHAFRPGRSPHTALRTLRSGFAGFLWFIKADLTSVAGSLPPDVIIQFLKKVVSDKKIISLVRSALKTPVRCTENQEKEVSGLMKKRLKRKMLRKSRKKKVLDENEPKPDPYWLRTFFGFSPKEAKYVPSYGSCGVLSPLLLNLCFSELDYWMEEKIDAYFKPSKSDCIWKEAGQDGSHNPAWPEFVPSSSGKEKTKKMDYLRFGCHVLVGIRGPREDAAALKKDLIDFCNEKFGSMLENSAVDIEHITHGIEFLDHIITRRVIYPTLRYTATGGKVVTEKCIGTMLSVRASLDRCIWHFRRMELVKGDKDPEPLPCLPMLYSGQAHTNSQMNKLLETLADWYRYSDNRKKIVGFCAYIIRSSLAKLYAARYRLKSRAKVYKISSRDLSRPLNDSSRNAAPEYSDLLRMGLVDKIEGVQFSHMSLIPTCDYTPFPRNWVPLHELILREHIKLQDPKFFCGLYKIVKRKQLSSPQDDLAKLVWSYKVEGVFSRKPEVFSQEKWNSVHFLASEKRMDPL